MLYLFQISGYTWFLLIVAAILLGVWTRFYLSDKNQTKITLSKVNRYFGFLFAHDFKVHTVDINGPNGAWSVVLKSDKCKIRIIQDRGDIYCELVPTWASEKKYMNLSTIIADIEKQDKHFYCPQQRRNIDSQLEFYSKLFYSHYEKVMTFVENVSKPFATAYK